MSRLTLANWGQIVCYVGSWFSLEKFEEAERKGTKTGASPLLRSGSSAWIFEKSWNYRCLSSARQGQERLSGGCLETYTYKVLSVGASRGQLLLRGDGRGRGGDLNTAINSKKIGGIKYDGIIHGPKILLELEMFLWLKKKKYPCQLPLISSSYIYIYNIF